MSWALKRQLLYIFILMVFFALLGLWIGYPYFNKPATCFDRKQNGNEAGIDCGGSCILQCSSEMDNVSILWSRIFEIEPGRYNAVAYLENQNINTSSGVVKYVFRFADAKNNFLGKREGESYVPLTGKFAIFEPAIDLGRSVPVYATFEFLETPSWFKVPTEKAEQLKLSVSDIKSSESDIFSLEAVVENKSLFTIPKINTIAILYNKEGNALSASRTFIDILGPEDKKRVFYTWPKLFNEEIVVKEILPIFNPFSAEFK